MKTSALGLGVALAISAAGLVFFGCGKSAGNNGDAGPDDDGGGGGICGNWIVEEGEECDDGPGNSNTEPDACRTDCTFSFCGDGVVDGVEECDLGFGFTTCQSLGFISGGELFCNADCTVDTTGCCGDGSVAGTEVCDDGNDIDWDGCSSCQIGEFQVNEHTDQSQARPKVAIHSDASFVVVWHSEGQDGDGNGIFARRYDATGAAVGAEIPVNSWTTGAQTNPQVALAADGSFVVVWVSLGQDGSGYGIYGQRFDAAGGPIGGEFRVNSSTDGQQRYPALAVAGDGSFTVFWATSSPPPGGPFRIVGQRFDAGAQLVGGELVVSDVPPTGEQRYPTALVDAGGTVVVTYAADAQDGNGWDCWARHYDAGGVAVAPAFLVNTEQSDHQVYPVVAPVAADGYVIVWQSMQQDGDYNGVFGRRFDNADAPVDVTEFQVNTYTTLEQRYPFVAGSGDGRFAVVWASEGQDGSANGLYGQRFDAAGAPDGAEFMLPLYTDLSQWQPAAAMAPDGRLIVVWSSEEQDGSGYGVYGQRIDSSGAPLGAIPW